VDEARGVNAAFNRVQLPGDDVVVVEFLTGHEWPFHSVPRLSADDVSVMDVSSGAADSYWISLDGERCGLVRLLDLDDVDDGSPVFDLRIAPAQRGRGLGRLAVEWLTAHLFRTYPALHRIEATTRHDNLAMQRVLDRCDFRLEGRLRESWRNQDGSRHDTLVYAILRSEWVPHVGA
jgi:RimJ/RimL family protein N-acetyltransferase